MANKKTGLMRRASAKTAAVSRPGQQIIQASQLHKLTRVTADPVEINKTTANGRAIVRLATGDYTYRAIPFGIKSDVDLGADSYAIKGGGFMVKLDALSKYITDVTLELDNNPLIDLTIDELATINDFYGFKFSEGLQGFHFPGEEMYDSQKLRDTFALGTANLKQVKLILKTTNLFDPGTMDIVCAPHYVMQPRPASFVTKINRQYASLAQGRTTYTDLPVHDDIAWLWIKGDKISHCKLEVDGAVLFDGHIGLQKGYLRSVNRDKAALDGQFFFDFHAEGEAVSLAALVGDGQRRRGAKIKLTLDTTEATSVEFLVGNVGTYQKVR